MATGVPIETLVTKAEEYATAMAQSEWAKWLHTWLKGEGWRETPRRAKPKVDRPVAKKKPAPPPVRPPSEKMTPAPKSKKDTRPQERGHLRFLFSVPAPAKNIRRNGKGARAKPTVIW